MSTSEWKKKILVLLASFSLCAGLLFPASALGANDLNLDIKLYPIEFKPPAESKPNEINVLPIVNDFWLNDLLGGKTDYIPLPSPAPIAPVRWEIRLQDNVSSPPAIGTNGTIYVGTHNKKLYAISPEGTIIWTVFLGGSAYSAPVIGHDGTIYIHTFEDRKLVAIAPNGRKKWDFERGLYPIGLSYISDWKNVGYLSSPAIAADGTIYAGGDENNTLYALDAYGQLKWSYQANGHVSTPSVGADGTVYVSAGSTQDNTSSNLADASVHAFHPDGTKKWSSEIGEFLSAPYLSAPAIGADGTLYVGSAKSLHAFDPENGSRKTIQGQGGAAEAYGKAYLTTIGMDGTLYAGNDSALFAVHPEGTKKWDQLNVRKHPFLQDSRNVINAHIAIGADGTLYTRALHSAMIYALSPSGDIQWVFASDKSYYYGKPNGAAATTESSGRCGFPNQRSIPYPEFKGRSGWCAPAVGSDGTVYAGAGDVLYALGTTAASSVVFNKRDVQLQVGEHETLIATVTPAEATNKQLAWSSSDSEVASVDEAGEVTALSPGEAIITATVKDGGFIATSTVTVR